MQGTVDDRHRAASQDSRVQFLILHFTAESFDSSLATLTRGPVSSHYLVRDEPPIVYRLVDESRRAWHAGESSWKGYTQLNASSIGIEIVNRGHDPATNTWQEYPEHQVDAVVELVKRIAREHDIAPDRILGHSDIAPQRRVDPGPRFPWKRLADAGLIVWPDGRAVAERKTRYERDVPSVSWFQARLAQHGYSVPVNGALDVETRNVIAAFQMKYRPARFDGEPDAETAALLDVLTSAGSGSLSALDDELARIASDPGHRLASLSVLAIREGRVVYEHQFGERFIGTAGTPARPAHGRTLYRVASISKLVTALGVMRLVESGKLALDEDVSAYLGYRLRNPHFPGAPITLRMLLTHTSSLRDGAFYFWPARNALKDVLVPGGNLYGKGLMWAADHPPGNYFSYCNLNSGVVATIMERVTGERFDRLMKRLVLDPLGVRGGFNPAEFSIEDLHDLATLYCKCAEQDTRETWNPGGPWLAQVDDYSQRRPEHRADASYEVGSNGTVFGPQGNLRVSAADLGTVMVMLMNNGEHQGRRFLSPESVNAMLSIHWRFDPLRPNGDAGFERRERLFNAWGLDVQVFLDVTQANGGDRLVEGGGFTAVGHLGDAYGLTGALVFDRERRNGMIFLIGGTAFDPATNPGRYSAFYRHEEEILTAIHRHAIAGEGAARRSPSSGAR